MKFNTIFWQLLIVLAFASSCGAASNSALKEEWDRRNDPIQFSPEFNYELATLPTEGTSEKEPWTDTYWPSYKGGLADRWNDPETDGGFDYELLDLETVQNMSTEELKKLSPAEKYALFTGDYTYRLVNSERSRTSPDNERWFGLCHGWAPAAINFAEPKPITLTGANDVQVPFGSSDIKALLTYFQQDPRVRQRTKFLGGRCNRNLSEDPDGGNSPECRDVNAGSFHVVVANQLGIHKQAFVADVTRDYEVWNQPISGFKSEIVSETEEVYENAAPDTVKIVTVETTMTYIVEINATWEAVGGTEWSRWYKRDRFFTYTLELDDQGRIIGGEWVNGERPDFMWLQSAPQFTGFWSQLETIYQAATATDDGDDSDDSDGDNQ